jgi:YaiO family outer membrane protein
LAAALEANAHCPERVRAQLSVSQLETQIHSARFAGSEVNLSASYSQPNCRTLSILGDRLKKFGRVDLGLGVGFGQKVATNWFVESELWGATAEPAILPRYRGLLGLRAYPSERAEIALAAAYRRYGESDLWMAIPSVDFQLYGAVWFGSTAYLGQVSGAHPDAGVSTIVVRGKWLSSGGHSVTLYISRGSEAVMTPEPIGIDLRFHEVAGASIRYQMSESFFLDASASLDATTDQKFWERRWMLAIGGWR